MQPKLHTKRFKLSWDQDLYELNTGVVDSLQSIHLSSLTKRMKMCRVMFNNSSVRLLLSRAPAAIWHPVHPESHIAQRGPSYMREEKKKQEVYSCRVRSKIGPGSPFILNVTSEK